MTHSTDEFFASVSALRTELVDLAFHLDRRGRPDAADLALGLSQRLTELCERFAESASSTSLPNASPPTVLTIAN